MLYKNCMLLSRPLAANWVKESCESLFLNESCWTFSGFGTGSKDPGALSCIFF